MSLWLEVFELVHDEEDDARVVSAVGCLRFRRAMKLLSVPITNIVDIERAPLVAAVTNVDASLKRSEMQTYWWNKWWYARRRGYSNAVFNDVDVLPFPPL